MVLTSRGTLLEELHSVCSTIGITGRPDEQVDRMVLMTPCHLWKMQQIDELIHTMAGMYLTCRDLLMVRGRIVSMRTGKKETESAQGLRKVCGPCLVHGGV